MQTVNVALDRLEAKRLWRDYKSHQHYEAPVDEQIRRAYWLISKGRTVIKALDSIKAAGLDANNRPKLAISRANANKCLCEVSSDGHAEFRWFTSTSTRPWPHHAQKLVMRDAFPAGNRRWVRAEAIIPTVPLHLRPKRALANYHILWEAEWSNVVARDPFLLRRIGKTDLWLVCAAWDLTEIEQAVLQSRVTG